MYEGIDTIVLYEELAWEDLLPVAWVSVPGTPEPALLVHQAERNLRLLQAASALEEYGQHEKPDENAPYAADIMRLDFKLNLLLDLVGQILAANQPRPSPVPVRFNTKGAVWRAGSAGARPRAGEQGFVEIHLRDCLVQPLGLYGQVIDSGADGRVKVRFAPLAETVSDLLEKLAFRRHRRQVADARNPRRS
ncbi:MAG: PilZ domain-containing protein [Gammaproteobacteria bacterium]|nr:PilZ domain-containing protein [Gammaproteobacteria bacterium]